MALLRMISKKLNKVFTSFDDGTIIEKDMVAKIKVEEKDKDEDKDKDNSSDKSICEESI